MTLDLLSCWAYACSIMHAGALIANLREFLVEYKRDGKFKILIQLYSKSDEAVFGLLCNSENDLINVPETFYGTSYCFSPVVSAKNIFLCSINSANCPKHHCFISFSMLSGYEIWPFCSSKGCAINGSSG